MIRLPLNEGASGPSTDDVLALAEAIREVGLGVPTPIEPPLVTRRKGHLAVVADL